MEAIRLSGYDSGQMPDTIIINRILGGEKELFEILLRRYNQTLYRAIRGYLKNEAEIRDIMQDTYLKAYEKLEQYRGDAAFATWLIRIGINEVLLRIRKQKKSRLFSLVPEHQQPENIFQLPDHTFMNPEKQVIRHEIRALVEKAIENLPEKFRIVYILKEIEGMNINAIAGCLSLSENNVKVRLHRARHLLKDALYRLSADASLFEFGNTRCDRLVEQVMSRIL